MPNLVDLDMDTDEKKSAAPSARAPMLAGRRARRASLGHDQTVPATTTPEPVAALAVDLVHRFSTTDLDVRVGVATGTALLFEGDDYIGSAVNMAARLCDYAQNVDVLMPTMHLDRMPEGVSAEPFGEVELRGFPGRIDVVRLVGAPSPVAMGDVSELWTRDLV